MTDTPKRGRPFKPPAERRNEQLLLKLTAAERAVIVAAASGGEHTVWAREVLLRAAKERFEGGADEPPAAEPGGEG